MKTRVMVGRVSLSNPDRVLFREARVTKLDLARFYQRIADWILPHVAGRPLTLVRCPEGVGEECFYMKHSKGWTPPELRHVRIKEKTKIGDYLVADTLDAVVALVQMNVLEIHTWNSTVDRLEHPDRIVLDIDPGAQVEWREVVRAARLVGELLEALRLRGFVKTTGGKGLHVVVPLEPVHGWADCLELSRAIATTLANAAPGLYTTTFAKAGREDKILIDYLRNNRTNTSVSAFSSRARPHAPVSVPLSWGELSARPRSDRYTVLTIERRLARLARDPWDEYWTLRQRFGRATLAALGRL